MINCGQRDALKLDKSGPRSTANRFLPKYKGIVFLVRTKMQDCNWIKVLYP